MSPQVFDAERLQQRIAEVVEMPLSDEAYCGILEYLYPRMSDPQMTSLVVAISGREAGVVHNDVLRV
jgi:hypothetical protein